MTCSIAMRRWSTLVVIALAIIPGCSKRETGPVDANGNPIGDTPRSEVPAELAGEWHSGRISYIGFFDRSTGHWGEPSGTGFSYKFTPDGYFEYGGLLQSTLYGCSQSFFSYRIGTVTVEGSTITIYPHFSQMRKDDACSPQDNYNRPGTLEAQRGTWRIGYSYGSARLYLTAANGTEQSFIRQ